MKKIFHTSNASYWNKLVRKFSYLNDKIRRLIFTKNTSATEVNILLGRLKKIYKKLKSLQVKVGIKVAGSALALMLATTSLNAQNFIYDGELTVSLSKLRNEGIAMSDFADLDNDAELELYVGDYFGKIKIFTNDGNGNFSAKGYLQADGTDIDVGQGLAYPVFADIDGDGDLDLYVGNNAGNIKVYLNDGNGNFTANGNLQADGSDITGIYFAFPDFADIDNDGDLDLYVGNNESHIQVYLNDGNGNFSANGNLQADGSDIVISIPAPEFADIDSDGDLDLYVGDAGGKINVFTNDGNGNFTSQGNLQADGTDIEVGSYANPVFADLDNDGDLDLYIGNYYGYILAYTNNDSGNFSSNGYLKQNNLDIVVAYYPQPTFADIDNDGDLDLYVGRGDGYIQVYLNEDGKFFAYGNLQADGSDINIGQYAAPTFADLDEDSDLDLYVGNGAGNIKVYLNDGNGNFSANGNLQADGTDIDVGWEAKPEFTDLDEDGDLDLYVGNSNGNIKVYLNDGNGNFSANGNLQADGSDINNYNNASPVFADIDGDADYDLYVGNSQGFINVYLNDGNGNLTANGNLQADGTSIDVGENAAPEFADLDNDGDLDLFVGKYYGKIRIYLNDGNGNFSASGNLQTYSTIVNVGWHSYPNFADIDNDGNLDLYVGNYNGNIIVFTNDGNGNFTDNGNLQADDTDIDVGYHATPNFANLDGDSDLDLYVGEYQGSIKVYTNDGNGNFTDNGNLEADNTIINLGGFVSPVFADLDNDGDSDLYVGNNSSDIKVYKNDGNGIFTSDSSLQADGNIIDITHPSPVFADLDKDSDLDLYVGNAEGNIKVYLNDGNGNFTANGNLQINGTDIDVGNLAYPVFADFDNDGDLDLFVGNQNGVIKKYINHEINTSLSQFANSDLEITAYPNPTTGILTINLEASAGLSRVFNCEIIDINGRVIKSYKNISSDNLQIDLSNQSKGLYFLKVYNDELVKNVKIILK